MTVPLSPGSPRAVHALRFGQELRRAMDAREVGTKRLAAAAGVAASAISNWRIGGNLPRTDTAAKLAEVLDWPALLRLSRAGRTVACARCGRDFVNEGGSPARFCSVACREVDVQLRRPSSGAGLAESVAAELDRKAGHRGGVPREPLALALDRYRLSESTEHARGMASAVDAMCRACEPEGICRTLECPLRPYSPLVASTSTARGPVRPAYAPEVMAAARAAQRAATVARWQRPGERERMAESSRAMHAALTDEEREERSRRISAGRRAS